MWRSWLERFHCILHGDVDVVIGFQGVPSLSALVRCHLPCFLLYHCSQQSEAGGRRGISGKGWAPHCEVAGTREVQGEEGRERGGGGGGGGGREGGGEGGREGGGREGGRGGGEGGREGGGGGSCQPSWWPL